MDNRVRDELALSAELNPLNPRRPTLRTNCSRRDHNVLAANAPDRHQFAICALSIELFDSWWRKFAQFKHSSKCELLRLRLIPLDYGREQSRRPQLVSGQPVPLVVGIARESVRFR